MYWYHFIACFFSGVFLANTVPHFVNGVSGNRFPTPFAKPPGRGLSSPLLNVIWAMINLVIGYLLFIAGKVTRQNIISIIVFFAGFFLMSIGLARAFSKKQGS